MSFTILHTISGGSAGAPTAPAQGMPPAPVYQPPAHAPAPAPGPAPIPAPVTEHPVPLLGGPRHEDVLTALHDNLKPATYLEIGVERGDTLRRAHCASIAIDPALAIDQGAIGDKPACLLYRMRSDDFFRNHDPAALLGAPIDMAFLDGMHLFEFLLRDFINIERHCRRNSVVIMHDCVPTDLYLARRHKNDERLRPQTRIPGGWCGDVWKVLPILRKYRPDLRVHTFDSALSGIVLVTNLDPASTVLADCYADAVDEFSATDLADYGIKRLFEELRIEDARLLSDPVHLARYAWL